MLEWFYGFRHYEDKETVNNSVPVNAYLNDIVISVNAVCGCRRACAYGKNVLIDS